MVVDGSNDEVSSFIISQFYNLTDAMKHWHEHAMKLF